LWVSAWVFLSQVLPFSPGEALNVLNGIVLLNEIEVFTVCGCADNFKYLGQLVILELIVSEFLNVIIWVLSSSRREWEA
jgi:hypothetical protein